MASGSGVGQCRREEERGQVGSNLRGLMIDYWWSSSWLVFSLPSMDKEGIGRECISPDCGRMELILSKHRGECSAPVTLSPYGLKAGIEGSKEGESLPSTYFYLLQLSFTTSLQNVPLLWSVLFEPGSDTPLPHSPLGVGQPWCFV